MVSLQLHDTIHFEPKAASLNMGLKLNMMVRDASPLQNKRSPPSDCVTISRRNSPSPVTPEYEELMSRVMKRTEKVLNNMRGVKKKLCPQHYNIANQDVDHQMSLFSISW